MSSLRFEEYMIPSASLNGESDLPSVLPVFNLQAAKSVELDEEDELFTDVGKIRNIYPYRQQSLYDRAEVEKMHRAAVLENEFLRAVFLPDLGGRLWSLYDKKAEREILYRNDVLKYCNLALRNAWYSGGVEWNIGMVGHTPFTCDPLFVSTLEASDGTPILRMYEYERLRGVTYQMDFSLPDGSQFLFCRMRICNLHDKTIPMYWWSNIAVPENETQRTIVPAESSYHSAWKYVAKTKFPERGGKDASYSVNTGCSMDFFFRLADEGRKYIASVDKDGYGLVQTSTSRLKGRKLFVWGKSVGGDTWQHWLTRDAGAYAEIQAGLGHTQYECIPMPPLCAWEWLEAYGPIQMDKETAHGAWKDAVCGVEENLDSRLDRLWLEEKLRADKADYVLKKGKLVSEGSLFGALENARREKEGLSPISEHLDFGQPGESQRDWTALLAGNLPCPDPMAVPPSDLGGEHWLKYAREAAKKDETNWFAHYVYGLLLLEQLRDDEAKEAFEKSLASAQSPWAYYALAACNLMVDDKAAAIENMKKAYAFRPDDICLAKDLCRLLDETGRHEELKAFCLALPEGLKNVGKLRFFLASALAHLGDTKEAEEILNENGRLTVPDIREGETSLTALWYYIKREEEKKAGKTPDPNLQPPDYLDFRMGHAPEDPSPYDETIG